LATASQSQPIANANSTYGRPLEKPIRRKSSGAPHDSS